MPGEILGKHLGQRRAEPEKRAMLRAFIQRAPATRRQASLGSLSLHLMLRA